MAQNALGLIEVVGLPAALGAADAAVKAANIWLKGYELTKGGGLIVVKLSGDVGAVKAAVLAGALAAAKINKVWATHVICRPHSELSKMEIVPSAAAENIAPETDGVLASVHNEQSLESGKKNGYGCNLCKDPVCTRKKGEPKNTCIHYVKNKEEV